MRSAALRSGEIRERALQAVPVDRAHDAPTHDLLVAFSRAMNVAVTRWAMRTSCDEALSATDQVPALDLLSGARARQD
jgi:hypothetical protein